MKNVHDGLSKEGIAGTGACGGLLRREVALEPDNISKLGRVQAGAAYQQPVHVAFLQDLRRTTPP